MFRTSLCLTLVGLLLATPVWAQNEGQGRRGRGGPGAGGGPGGFGGGSPFQGRGMGLLGIIRMDAVQEKLAITEDEKAFVDLLAEETEKDREKLRSELESLDRGARMERLREVMGKQIQEEREKIAEILGKDRTDRLRQIQLQFQGLAGSLRDPDVQKAISLTEEQVEKMQETMRSQFREMRETFQSGGAPDPEKMREAMASGRAKVESAVAGVLTADQKKAWEKLVGEPAGIDPPPPNFGRGQGGPGGPGGPGGAERGRRGQGGDRERGENPDRPRRRDRERERNNPPTTENSARLPILIG